jgi:hypothetical protein
VVFGHPAAAERAAGLLPVVEPPMDDVGDAFESDPLLFAV